MRRYKHSVLLGLCLLLGGCGGMSVKSIATMDYDHSYDFSHVRKIAIQPISRDTLSTVRYPMSKLAELIRH